MSIAREERVELAREIRAAAARPTYAADREALLRIAALVRGGDIDKAAVVVESLYSIIRDSDLARPFNLILLVVGRPRGLFGRWADAEEHMTTCCGRCGGDARISACSIFNAEQICQACEAEEKAHPDYERAREIEADAVRRGDYNFPGVGLPPDLREAARKRAKARGSA
ncbi:unnamed protein product [marine sediment metagenome]|uniref:Uncharacterized protein n=1 Tax=marine sediment metagenome TaxID=412755 RepID=X0TIY0_9ZZZZ